MTDAEIIKAVAERVMGWKEVPVLEVADGTFYFNSCTGEVTIPWPERGPNWVREWHPIPTPNDWMMVVDKLVSWKLLINLGFNRESPYAQIWSNEEDIDFLESADSIGRAICLAALRAVGVEI